MQYLTNESCLVPYMVFPRFLLDMELNETSKIIYILLLDRARLSLKSDKWTDSAGHTFIYFPVRSIAEAIHKSEMTVKTALASLEKKELIVRIKQGAGMPSRIYIKIPSETDRKLSARETENCPSEGKKTVPRTDRILTPIKNNRYKTNYQQKEYRDYSYTEDESL